MDTEWAWLAGFFDGDGCVSATSPRGENTYFHIRVMFTQKDPLPLHRITQIVGSGNVRCKVGSKYHVHSLKYGNRVSAIMLERMRPFVIAKAAQVDVALRMIAAQEVEDQVILNQRLVLLKRSYASCT